MIRFYFLWLLIVSSFNALAVEISEFKAGYACTDGKTFGWICHEVQDIYITGQSICSFNGEDIPCTWHGFSFNYRDNKEGDVISCEYNQSLYTNHGNPEQIISKNTNSGSFKFELEDEEGHFFNPQYIGLKTAAFDESIHSNYTVCKSQGKILFEFGFRMHFPVSEEQ